MSGYICTYCNKTSGTTKVANGPDKGKEKPAISTRNCSKSPSGEHHWIKK